MHFADLAPTSGRRTVKRVLARLRDLRVLGALMQRVGGVHGGSQGLVHYVDGIGDRILRGRSGRDARRTYEPSARFVNHRLAIAELHVALIAADRCGELKLTDGAVEPATWRTFVGVGAARRTLKPDLYAETATEGDLVHAWFIEVDLGTEHIPTLLAKCREYETYRQTGIEQDRHGAFPLVVWSISHPEPAKAERRRQALADAIAADGNLPSALFRIVAPEHVISLIRNGGAL
ncbi:replication-relaxation family protein [Mycobacterium sp. Aquia_213]|uniref:replication-relaxation family protein n=1 Tax=Mycobacterium sp. Aquia_213 TaxID=2991728 RepID=UPI00226DF312|nr:replication-relaxation family protein [Mycobacterium sp. Aquia_213]WAC94468.1 replication-relaxation family protein [Mycobacterium sp. Aquia_213]